MATVKQQKCGCHLQCSVSELLEPTNNRAERAPRPAVIARKVSQCSKNQPGADAFAAFASVTRTSIQRGSSPIDALVALFRGAPLPPPPSPPP